jgi:AcrR family transcriptional regulator
VSHFQRARSPVHKETRASALVTAARTLALRDGVRSVTLTGIATAAGMHVSGVRRYFGSREEIFLVLAAAEWTGWAAAVRDELGGEAATADELAAVLSRTLADRPLFCDLLGHVQLSLEREVSAAAVLAYKLESLAALAVLRDAIGLPSGTAQDLVAGVTAMAGTLWQTAHPPATLDRLYREDPRLAHAVNEFTPRLARLTAALVRGLTAE